MADVVAVGARTKSGRLFPVRTWLRLLFGALSLAFGLLPFVPPPCRLAWYAGVGVTEWGHVIALLGLIPFLPGWRATRPAKVAAACGAIGVMFCLSSIFRAGWMASNVGADVQRTFGDTPLRSSENAAPRPAPLVWSDIVCGVSRLDVQPNSVVYSSPDGVALSLDLYLPPQTLGPIGPKVPHSNPSDLAPVIVMIHGGSWHAGNRGELPAINAYLASRGYAVASIDYRLAPQHKFPAALEDVRAAIAYLKEHAAELNLDAQRIVLMGRSAGGHLALLSAYTANDPAIRGVVAIYPPTDLTYAYDHPSNPRVLDSKKVLEEFLGGTPGQVPDAYAAASPVNFVNAMTPPTLLIHGERDDVVYILHSERIAERLSALGRPYYLLRIPWGNHGCDANLSGPGGQLAVFAIERFLAAETK
jgi:acetyl esterase/lipase